ncbi:integral membrane protein [Sarocladium implicatum]|nr:integral membrane protein [Sarocladium implicatum]
MASNEHPSTSMISSNDNKGPAVLGAVLSVIVVATLLVFARLYARGRLLKRYFLDDFFVVLALACAWIAVGFQIAAVKHGFGRHIYTLTPSQRTLAIKYQTIAYVPGIISSAIPKLAVVALLTRVFANTASRWHRVFLWVMTITCYIFNAIVAAFVLLQCRPLQVLWDPSTEGSCWNRNIQIRIAVSATVFSAVVDLYLALYPTIVLTILRISRIKKFMLSFALGFGFISAIVAAYKATLIHKLESPDMTYAVAELSIWTIVEGCTVTIATTIPVLQPVVYRLFGDGALGSKRRDDNGPQHRFHRRIGDGSDETHVVPVRDNEPEEYMGQGVFITKNSSVSHAEHVNDFKSSHTGSQTSAHTFEGVSAAA